MKNNIIFLDINGVMSTRKTRGIFGFSHIHALNNLCDETSAKVVITSTMRYHYDLEDMQNLFMEYGFDGQIIGYTPHKNGMLCGRDEEISDYIKEHHENINNFVIFDDMEQIHTFDKHFILVDSTQGLNDDYVDKAIDIFKKSL